MITIYWYDHPLPHVHARYGEHEAQIDIATGDVLAGSLPRRAKAMVRRWTRASIGIAGGVGSSERRRDAREDRAAAVMPPILSQAPWRVVDMSLLDGRSMRVRFVDGVEGDVHFHSGFFRGVFAHLIDPVKFAEARVEMGAVTWPGELDLAPDRMHDDIVKDGACVLQ